MLDVNKQWQTRSEVHHLNIQPECSILEIKNISTVTDLKNKMKLSMHMSRLLYLLIKIRHNLEKGLDFFCILSYMYDS